MNAVILLAAGRGNRMKNSIPDKILHEVEGCTLFAKSLLAFRKADVASLWIVTYRDESQKERLSNDLLKVAPDEVEVILVEGGAERRHSVQNALAKIPLERKIIFVHDCARPMIQAKSLNRLLSVASETGAATLAHPVRDTLKQTRDGQGPHPIADHTVDRSKIWAMETPQTFQAGLLREGMARAVSDNLFVTDETSAVELLGHSVSLVDPGYPNPKVTTPSDLSYIEFLINKNKV
jgi:2-C-methyl-D-erythritol 4-phosphate cytidylyltransferase